MKTTVPIDIREPFETILGREKETWSLSSSRNRKGDPGETWIVATRTRLIIGDRGFGGPVTLRETPLKSITGVEIEGAAFGSGRAVLVGKTGALDHICFSSIERDDFAQFGARLKSDEGSVEESTAQVVGSPPAAGTARRPRVKPVVKEAEVPMAAVASTLPAPKATPTSPPPKASPREPLPPPDRKRSGAFFEVFLDSPVGMPGGTISGTLRLVWPKSRAVRAVRLWWRGNERTHVHVSRGKSGTTYVDTREWSNLFFTFFGSRQPLGSFEAMSDAMRKTFHPTLEAGIHEWPFTFPVPVGAPGNYAGRNVDITWALFAEVDIPRAFDVSERWSVRVIPPMPATVGAREGVCNMSVTLRNWVDPGPIGPGGMIKGRFRVMNPQAKKIRAVVLQVVRREAASAKGHRRVTDYVEMELRQGARDDGDAQEFAIRLPPSFCPWHGAHSSLSYVLRTSLDIAWGFDALVEHGIA